jgi:hypothetical protein
MCPSQKQKEIKWCTRHFKPKKNFGVGFIVHQIVKINQKLVKIKYEA